jgi:hypothetical protein
MIIAYDKLRKSIEPPDYDKRDRGTSILEERQMNELVRSRWLDRIEYAKTMALINIAQELNEIKHKIG